MNFHYEKNLFVLCSGQIVTSLTGTTLLHVAGSNFHYIYRDSTNEQTLLYFSRNVCAGCGEDLVELVSKLKCSYKMSFLTTEQSRKIENTSLSLVMSRTIFKITNRDSGTVIGWFSLSISSQTHELTIHCRKKMPSVLDASVLFLTATLTML